MPEIIGLQPKQGEVWWANLDPTIGSEINKRRPVVVIGSNIVNAKRRTVLVIPLSTSAKAFPPITVGVKCQDRQVTAVIDQLRAIDKTRLVRRIETVALADLQAIFDALNQIVGQM